MKYARCLKVNAAGNNKTCWGLRLSRRIFIKARNIKRHVSQSSWSGADTCGQADGRTDKSKLIGAFREYVTADEKVNFSLFLYITLVDNEAASIYNLGTKWRQETIFARSLQVCTAPRSSRPAVFRPQWGYSLERHPKYLLQKPVITVRPVNFFLYVKIENCKKSLRICEI